jgi:hypothetical protein
MLTEKDIREYQGDPRVLDRLAIATPRGQLMGMFGLGAELYVELRELHQLRLDMLEVQEDYYRRFKPHLDKMRYCWADNPDGKIIKLPEENPFPMVRQQMEPWPEMRSYTNVLIKRYVHPDFPKDGDTVTPWAGNLMVTNTQYKELSYYHCYLPVGDGQGGYHFEPLRECVLEWATRLRPAHGLAGFTVIMEVATISGEPYACASMRRFPGLDFQNPVSFIGNAESIHNRIKCVNWLTVLGDQVLGELGGLEAARQALEPECKLWPYPEGVMIQAGPVPQLGDTHAGIMPQRYQKVARFTRPVRFEGYTSSLFRVFQPMEGREEARKWVHRFD